jgi:SAM-dependent methyltransferase
MTAKAFLDRKLYPGVDGHWDDRMFRERIMKHITLDSEVLDIGAGAGIVEEMNFKTCARRVVGVDPDERVLQNPYLHEAHVGTGERLPLPDASFDVVFADNVMEHLDDPETVFREIHRVLKPGGVFLGKTPNAWHYMPVIARWTPHWFHSWVNRKRGRAEVDTFPTRYRVNSKPAIERLAGRIGFEALSIERIEGRPEYLRLTPPTYLVGWVYEKLVNATDALAPFRILLIATLRKPAPPAA